jgi:hypothetical protein
MICLVLIIQERENAGSQVKAEATFPFPKETVAQIEAMKCQVMSLSRILWIPSQYNSEMKGKPCEEGLYFSCC